MRKLLFFVFILVSVLACQKLVNNLAEEPHVSIKDNPALTKGGSLKSPHCKKECNINYSTAKVAAERIFAPGKKLEEFYPFVVENDTLFYVANYDKGYKVISSDTRTSAVLLESEDGKFSLENKDKTFNAPLFWMDNVASDIYALKEGFAESESLDNTGFWEALSNVLMTRIDSIGFEDEEHVWVKILDYETSRTYDEINVNHLIETQWGQYAPWNVKVPYAAFGNDPHCPTGCTAVAVAQMLYFTHYNLGKPTWLNHDAQISGIVYDSDNYNWCYFPGIYTENSPRWDQMAINQYYIHTDYVSSLMADVGHVLGIQYNPEGSGAYIDVEDLNHYGIYCTKSAYNMNTVVSNLLLGNPVIITAYAGENSFLGIHISYYDGHAWIIDGLNTHVYELIRGYVWRRLSDLDYYPSGQALYTEEQAMELEPNLFSGKTVVDTSRAYSYFYRMNWGWDGSYYDNVLYGATSEVWSGSTYNFQYDKQIFHNIH